MAHGGAGVRALSRALSEAGALADRYGGRAQRLVAYLAQPMWQREPSTLERWGDVARAVGQATGNGS